MLFPPMCLRSVSYPTERFQLSSETMTKHLEPIILPFGEML